MEATEQEMTELLRQLLESEEAEVFEVESVRSFEEAGLLTRDAGLVVRFRGGEREFQVTVVAR